MPLYSYKGNTPSELPERIRLSNGTTRTDSSTFTEEEIADAGYVLANDPPTVTLFQTLSWNQTEWVVQDLSADAIEGLKNDEWGRVREKRNYKLQSSDWEIIKRLELKESIPESLTVYRQQLRDITLQTDPFNITWPTIQPIFEIPPDANLDYIINGS